MMKKSDHASARERFRKIRWMFENKKEEGPAGTAGPHLLDKVECHFEERSEAASEGGKARGEQVSADAADLRRQARSIIDQYRATGVERHDVPAKLARRLGISVRAARAIRDELWPKDNSGK